MKYFLKPPNLRTDSHLVFVASCDYPCNIGEGDNALRLHGDWIHHKDTVHQLIGQLL